MSLELIDSHTHLDAKEFDVDREEVIARAKEVGVKLFLTIGAGDELHSAKRAIALSQSNSCIFASAGIHPHDAGKSLDLAELEQLAAQPKVVAIGETGLDFYRDWAPVDKQEEFFRAQIKLALKLNKPLIIHSREAGEACLKILQELDAAKVGGVFHCYSENSGFANRLAEINFLVSVPGSITFKKAEALRAALKDIPLQQIMLETDAPYLAPEPFRGKRCESSFMLKTAETLAKLKNLPLQEIARITSENAIKLFGLKL